MWRASFILAIALTTQANAQVPRPAEVSVGTVTEIVPGKTHTLEIADEIYPAVIPYFECIQSGANKHHQGVNLLNKLDVQLANERILKGCVEMRSDVAARASRSLDDQSWKSPKERKTLVDETLTSIERFFLETMLER